MDCRLVAISKPNSDMVRPTAMAVVWVRLASLCGPTKTPCGGPALLPLVLGKGRSLPSQLRSGTGSDKPTLWPLPKHGIQRTLEQ
jgi:hypothetical protein